VSEDYVEKTSENENQPREVGRGDNALDGLPTDGLDIKILENLGDRSS
jgi:hypothetical protein